MAVMMRSAWLGASLLYGAVCIAAAAPPDLTGMWTASRDGRAGPALNDMSSFTKNAPFSPAARAKLAAYRALITPTGDSPGAHCVGTGVPGALALGGGYPMEIIQRPEQITIIYEAHSEIRRIYMKGPKVDDADLIPSRDGYSTGKWEGNTLVVETTGLEEAVDQTTAHSANAKLVERYSLATIDGKEVLKADVTIVDPEFYTKPATVSFVWSHLLNSRMLIYDCTEPAWQDHLEELSKQAAAKPAAK
jgi:hypothetical protein